jgi:hypothetical protein
MPAPAYRKILHWNRTLHVYGTMLALILLIFFSFTGFVMNHSAWFSLDKFDTTEKTAQNPMPEAIAKGTGDATSRHAMDVEVYLRMHEGARGERSNFDDREDSVFMQFTGAGRKMEYTISRADGKIDEHFEIHGSLSLMSDLHRGIGTGAAWRLFIDATAIFLLFASLTGVILWISLPKRRTLGIIALAASLILCGACWFLLP